MQERRWALRASGSRCSASCSAQKGPDIFPAFATGCFAILYMSDKPPCSAYAAVGRLCKHPPDERLLFGTYGAMKLHLHPARKTLNS